MRVALVILLSFATLLPGCGQKPEATPTGPSTASSSNEIAHSSAADVSDESSVNRGVVIARVIGPHEPTPETSLSAEPNPLGNFWVTLEVTDIRDGFGPELKGQTIRLPTQRFDSGLVGQTLPLRLFRPSDRPEGMDYWLFCSSLEISRLFAR